MQEKNKNISNNEQLSYKIVAKILFVAKYLMETWKQKK